MAQVLADFDAKVRAALSALIDQAFSGRGAPQEDETMTCRIGGGVVSRRVVNVSPDLVTVDVDGELCGLRWADLRDAASERNAADLRAVYGLLLDEARSMARERGLVSWRVEGYSPSQGDVLMGPLGDLTYMPGLSDRRVISLDPDEVEEIRGAAARARRLAGEIAKAEA